ncbi:MAG TPA: carbonic anhydrase family protein, partial [bacterium]|nr:carbonic anhydrase family protein [bacterium]
SADCVRGAAMSPERRDGSTWWSASAVVLCLALGARVATAEAPAAAPSKPEVQTRESQAAMTPSQALDRLKAGNARFVANATRRRDWSAKVVATAAGQFPFAAVLGCMDSRAPVEIVFDQGIGDVFAVRVGGNVVNDDELGSLEYAVKVGAKLIVVLGHTSCGAVKGAIDGVQLGNLTGLLAKIHPAVEAAHCSDSKDSGCVTKVAEENVRQSMRAIRERSPYVAKYLDDGTVALVGGMYDVATGRVTFLDH